MVLFIEVQDTDSVKISGSFQVLDIKTGRLSAQSMLSLQNGSCMFVNVLFK